MNKFAEHKRATSGDSYIFMSGVGKYVLLGGLMAIFLKT
jgi:hypothetical protein